MRVLVDTLWWGLKPQDWIALGLIALVPALMVIAIYPAFGSKRHQIFVT
jgi:hypothetical protein